MFHLSEHFITGEKLTKMEGVERFSFLLNVRKLDVLFLPDTMQQNVSDNVYREWLLAIEYESNGSCVINFYLS